MDQGAMVSVTIEAKRIMRVLGPFGQLVSRAGATPLLRSLPAVVQACSPQPQCCSASTRGACHDAKDQGCDPQTATQTMAHSKADPTFPSKDCTGAMHPAILKLKEQIKELQSLPSIFSSEMSFMAANDLKYFRSPEYGRDQCSKELMDNLDFYRNKIPSRPRGDWIDCIHKEWFGKYHLLEQHHGYIQWLFPLCEPGVNWEAQELQLPELEQMRKDPSIRHRVRKSYELMLDFYGFILPNPSTGELERSNSHTMQFMNLVTRSHNYLRITRILKFLGLMGMTHYQTGFLARLLEEMVYHGNLHPAASSLQHYWLPTLLDTAARAELERIVAQACVHEEASDGEDSSTSFSSWAGRFIPGHKGSK